LNNIIKIRSSQIKNHWYETYWAFDLHGTIIKPNHKKGDVTVEYYPYALESLKLLSERDHVRLIMSTASYPDEMDGYREQFKKDGIYFNYENENIEINSSHFGYYKDKWYFDILFEDKAGFNSDQWKQIYEFLSNETWRPSIEWKRKDVIVINNIPILIPNNIDFYKDLIIKQHSTKLCIDYMRRDKLVPKHSTDEEIKIAIKKLWKIK
jgi:hypothetical protein